MFLYNGPLLCGFNVFIKELSQLSSSLTATRSVCLQRPRVRTPPVTGAAAAGAADVAGASRWRTTDLDVRRRLSDVALTSVGEWRRARVVRVFGFVDRSFRQTLV